MTDENKTEEQVEAPEETKEETKETETPVEAETATEETLTETAPEPETETESTPAPQPEAEPEVIPDDEDTSEIEGEEINRAELNRHIKPGMVVRVHEIIKDITPSGEERRRVQIFEGTVLGLKAHGIGRTMTIRKVSKGFGVEKIYPLASPTIEKVEIVKIHKVRRAKLNFLKGVIKRNRVKRRFKRKLKEVTK